MNATLSNRSFLQTLRMEWLLLVAALLALMAASAFAASPSASADGKRLHDANCRGCHDTAVYTRKGRSVHSLGALSQQLESCGHASGKDLSPAEKQQIIRYLNEQFYKFH